MAKATTNEANEVNNTITLTKEECTSIFGEEAKKVAQIVCGQGQCMCGYYKCGHSNCLPLDFRIGNDTVCPLAKYEAKVDTTPWWEHMGDQVTLDGLFAICACCDYATTKQDVEGMVVHYNDLHNHCLDCPVHMARENLMESIAEAGCS